MSSTSVPLGEWNSKTQAEVKKEFGYDYRAAYLEIFTHLKNSAQNSNFINLAERMFLQNLHQEHLRNPANMWSEVLSIIPVRDAFIYSVADVPGYRPMFLSLWESEIVPNVTDIGDERKAVLLNTLSAVLLLSKNPDRACEAATKAMSLSSNSRYTGLSSLIKRACTTSTAVEVFTKACTATSLEEILHPELRKPMLMTPVSFINYLAGTEYASGNSHLMMSIDKNYRVKDIANRPTPVIYGTSVLQGWDNLNTLISGFEEGNMILTLSLEADSTSARDDAALIKGLVESSISPTPHVLDMLWAVNLHKQDASTFWGSLLCNDKTCCPEGGKPLDQE